MVIFSIPSFLMNRSSLSLSLKAQCSQLPCLNLCDSLRDLALESVRKLEKIPLHIIVHLVKPKPLGAFVALGAWLLDGQRSPSSSQSVVVEHQEVCITLCDLVEPSNLLPW